MQGSRPLFFGVVIDPLLYWATVNRNCVFSSPLLRGGFRIDNLKKESAKTKTFSSPILRGSYRTQIQYYKDEIDRCSRPLFYGGYRIKIYVQCTDIRQGSSSPVLRGGYRISEQDTIITSLFTFSSPVLRGSYRIEKKTDTHANE